MEKKKRNAMLAGASAGIVNGLFGAGGGMLLVPLLTRLCGLEERKTFATALSVVLPLCLVSLGVYCLHGAVDWTTAWPYLVGGFFGGIGGGLLLRRMPVRLLHGALGLLILWGAVRAWQ